MSREGVVPRSVGKALKTLGVIGLLAGTGTFLAQSCTDTSNTGTFTPDGGSRRDHGCGWWRRGGRRHDRRGWHDREWRAAARPARVGGRGAGGAGGSNADAAATGYGDGRSRPRAGPLQFRPR